ncbi:MAG: hypothetical protein R3286_12135 [Gammaproteobacteria bacterium]|nr:hypothetical protein [Gammaproteobacteria bacterium]
MNAETVGFTFDETMAGGFALEESDPESGRIRGEREGSELAMHATVELDDIDSFVADPDHRGKLSGTIDFTPFGEGLHAPIGVFNLFRPTTDPALKLMVYELGFEHGGRAYYLAGKKMVRDAAVTELWKATTTLYTRLHEGADESGPVIGAGVLTLSVKQLMALVSTMKVLGAQSTKQEAAVLMKFGTFFMGDLWDTYVKHRGR